MDAACTATSKIVRAQDNLSIDKSASLYEAFPPAGTRGSAGGGVALYTSARQLAGYGRGRASLSCQTPIGGIPDTTDEVAEILTKVSGFLITGGRASRTG